MDNGGYIKIYWYVTLPLCLPIIATVGVFNFVGNLSGITVPLVVGYLARDHGFGAGLTYVATLALLGALSYIFVVGTVERLPDGAPAPPPA